MELTGKALLDFWAWYLLPKQKKTYKTASVFGTISVVKVRFLAMSFAERWGVYQDFADSLGIEIYAEKSLCREGFVSLTDSYPCGYFNTRTEARKAAIDKLNELLNK